MAENKTLSDEITNDCCVEATDTPFDFVFVSSVKKHLQEFKEELKKSFDECADKTDIWDNERYDKFRKIFIKELNTQMQKHFGDKLI